MEERQTIRVSRRFTLPTGRVDKGTARGPANLRRTRRIKKEGNPPRAKYWNPKNNIPRKNRSN